MQHTKPIMEELARARNYFRRHDILRSMISLATAVKDAVKAKLAGRDKSLVENATMEMVQMLNRTQEVKRFCASSDGLALRNGDFKALFHELMSIIKSVRDAANKESIDQTRARKLELDNQLGHGQRALAAGKFDEARDAFKEAEKLYVNEHKLFHIIGNMLFNAGQHRLALRYYLQGLEVDPEPNGLVIDMGRTYIALGEYAKAETLLHKYAEGSRDPDIFAMLAQAQAKQNQARKALRNAAMGLKLNPGHTLSRQLFSKLRKIVAQQPQNAPSQQASSNS